MQSDEERLSESKERYERATKGPRTLKDVKYGLYDKIKGKVTVRAMDIIIYSIVALIVVALIVGIVLGQ